MQSTRTFVRKTSPFSYSIFVDEEGAVSLYQVREDEKEVLGAALARGPLREWILELPEAKVGLEMGILEEEKQAVETAIHSLSQRFDSA